MQFYLSVFPWSTPFSPFQIKEPTDSLSTLYAPFKSLIPCALPSVESAFAGAGQVQVYREERGIVIFREVRGVPLTLQPCSSCLSLYGFTLSEKRTVREEGKDWKGFSLVSPSEKLEGRSIIIDMKSGEEWTNHKDWKRDCLFKSPFRRYLIITKVRDPIERGEFF